MKQKTKDTLNELVRREYINEKHEPITQTDINDMIEDVQNTDDTRKSWKYFALGLLIGNIIFTIIKLLP